MLKQKTTIDHEGDQQHFKPHNEGNDAPGLKKNGSTEKAMGSNAKDQTRSQSESTQAPLDMGSRWCPEEIELFYNGKFLPANEY